MDLQNLIEPRIWDLIRSNYENCDYTGAILDATQFLTDLLREKAGVEDDGVALVGQALGGKTPRLKLTKLQSETDRNIQSGIEQIIRGVYQAIHTRAVMRNTATIRRTRMRLFTFSTTSQKSLINPEHPSPKASF